MFRDAKEELERLEQQLLQEDMPEEEAQEEEQEDYSEFLPEEGEQTEGPVVYRNFSNGYGSQLRNYATGYKAYNADKVDTDMEQFSEEVREPKTASHIWLPAVILGLMATVVAAIIWVYVSMGGGS